MSRVCMSGIALIAAILLFASETLAQQPAQTPRQIRLAVFEFDVLEGVEAPEASLTDQVVTLLSAMERVQLVSREELSKVADEQKVALSGLVDTGSAVRLGKFVSAQYIVCGRASRISSSYYLVLKLVDVETTIQHTVAVKAAVEGGVGALIERLEEPLTENIRKLQAPPAESNEEEQRLAALVQAAKPLSGKVFLVDVSEEHVDRPLADPAAATAVAHRLNKLGVKVVTPVKPIAGWKQHLLETGRYGDQQIDYLIEGEALSGFAASIQGLTSCRARVELRVIAAPGRSVQATDRGAAAAVDLVEALAAKTALEEAAIHACDATIGRLLESLKEK